uniref:Uncharacterized protein n=1 Tax=Craspedostauros australis TaxID=1486917 RepID=A0A7R9WYC2_9STRA
MLGFYDAPGNRPRQQPKGLPPRLTKELLIENVSQLWKEAETNRAQQCAQEAAQRRTGLPKCPFSWVSGLSQQQNNEKWVLEYFQSRASVWRGWQLEAEGGKTGFVPQKVTDEIVLDFELPQTIRTVTLFWMKSYGPKWQNSHVDVVVDGNAPRALVGYHAKNTSEMYTESVPVHIPANQPFRIQCKLVGGTTFKLMGMAVCS